MTKSNNGGGASKVITADEHNATRRAKKAHQRSNGGRSGGNQMGDLFGSVLADKRAEIAEERRNARVERETRNWEFRVDQVAKARTYEWFTQLKVGTPAHRFADAVLDAFPLADPPADKSQSRTQVAELEALVRMSDKDLACKGAVEHGRRVARKALYWAHDQLKASADTQQLASTS